VTDLKRTPLHAEHIRAGGKMVEFAGYKMPIQYPTGIVAEHRAVRTNAGLFDLSHMGELRITDASLAQRVVTRDLTRLKDGRIQYALLCNEKGGIIDDVLVYAMADGSDLLVVNAGNQDGDFEWIRSQGDQSPAVLNVGREWALVGVQGPRAVGLVQRLTEADLGSVKYYAFVEGTVADVPCVISRTGYTGEDGFELFCRNAGAERLWRALLEEGTSDGIRPAGLGARDTLRLEAGMRLYGNDMDADTNPLEAGLDWTLNLDKDFVGRDAILQAREQGLSRRLVGFKMLDRSIARHGYRVVSDGQQVGTVTSGNVSFTLGYNIGMAYVPPVLAEPGTRLGVEVRGMAAPAEVVPMPFYQRPHPK